jgi:hypothetical protein
MGLFTFDKLRVDRLVKPGDSRGCTSGAARPDVAAGVKRRSMPPGPALGRMDTCQQRSEGTSDIHGRPRSRLVTNARPGME